MGTVHYSGQRVLNNIDTKCTETSAGGFFTERSTQLLERISGPPSVCAAKAAALHESGHPGSPWPRLILCRSTSIMLIEYC